MKKNGAKPVPTVEDQGVEWRRMRKRTTSRRLAQSHKTVGFLVGFGAGGCGNPDPDPNIENPLSADFWEGLGAPSQSAEPSLHDPTTHGVSGPVSL